MLKLAGHYQTIGALGVTAALALGIAALAAGGSSNADDAGAAAVESSFDAASALALPLEGPRGLLTLRLEDGSVWSVRVDDPARRLEAAAPTADSDAAADGGTYPSPDGRFVAAVQSDEAGTWLEVTGDGAVLATFPLAGIVGDQLVGGDKVAAARVDGVPLTVEWSPDGSMLAFGSVIGAPWTLNVASAVDWTVAAHEVRGGYVGELAWSPDSSLLAISTYEIDRSDHTVLLFEPARQSVRFLVDGCAIVWSPDGAYVAVHREPRVESGVWIADVSSDELRQVAVEAGAFPLAWAVSPAS